MSAAPGSYFTMTEPELAYLLARYGLIVFTRPKWGHVFLITPTNGRTVGDGTYTAEFRMVGDIPVVAEYSPLPTGRKPLEEVLTRARLAELDALERAAEEAGEAATGDSEQEIEQAILAAYRARDAAHDALCRAMFGPRPSDRPQLYVRIDRARRDVSVLTAADLDDYTPLTPDWFAIDDLPDSVTYDQLLELVRLRRLGEDGAAKAALLLAVFGPDPVHAVVSTKYRQVTVCSAEALQTHWYTSRCEKLTLPGCVLYAYEPLGDPARFPSDLPDRLRELERLYLVMDTTPGGWNPKGPLRRAYRDYQLALAMELAGTPLRRSPRLRRA